MWVKREREAKKVVEESAAAKSSTAAKGTKRKAPPAQASASNNITITTTYTIGGSSIIQDAAPAAKKAKTTKKPASATTTPKKANEPKPKPAKAPAARKPAAKAARAGPSRPATAAVSSSRSVNYDHDEPPPPYSEFSNSDFDRNNVPARSSYDGSPQRSSPQRPKLGLLNRRYDVSCPYVEHNYPEHEGQLGLIVTMDGNELWVKFDFGDLTGMMNLPRPWDSGEQRHVMHWRGVSEGWYKGQNSFRVDTDYLAGDENYLIFLGNGHIRGSISRDDDEEIHFDVYRQPGPGPYSEITRNQAREEWDRLEDSR